MKNNKIRGEMYTSIRGYNRHLSIEILVEMDIMTLLRNCHPIARIDFVRHLKMNLTPRQRFSLFGRTSPLRHKFIKS